MAEKKKVSMREVSKLSGVSIATVSRVIHNNGRFSDETAKRVMDVMKELNYTPDVLAQGMRKRSIAIIGIIVPDILDDRFGLMVRITQEKLFEKGYSTVVFNSNENGAQSQRFIDSLISAHVSGLIYVAESSNTNVDLKGLPTVFFERKPLFDIDTPSTTIVMNDYEAGRAAVDFLIKKEKKNVLILGDSLGISLYQERTAGAVAALEEAKCQYTVLKLEPQRTKATIAALEKLLEEKEWEYDAIYSTSIRMTIGALKVLHDRKELQEKMLLLGIGEHRLHEYGLLSYYAMREPLEEMAEVAADSIVRLIDGEEIPEQVFTISKVC